MNAWLVHMGTGPTVTQHVNGCNVSTNLKKTFSPDLLRLVFSYNNYSIFSILIPDRHQAEHPFHIDKDHAAMHLIEPEWVYIGNGLL